ncbi:hypothetical protein [Lachnoclostridium sp. Marseille-P6806]|uniref:hypothetical protein n=1 Tax=Lachnoclostridium sp. Marseille-P6806 TaxID=2364793 RepID=UPI0013EF0BD9
MNKLLKLDPTNTTLLAQKQGLKNLEKEAKNTDSSIAAALKQTGSKLQEVGGKISGVGETLSKDITAPITAIGAASLAAFNEVDAGNVAAIHEARVSASEHHILERFQQA